MLMSRALVVCSMLLLGGAAMADPAETAKAAGEKAQWLAIQTAENSAFDGKTLTLRGTNPAVVMFTDRPRRVAESMPVATFVGGWAAGGKQSFASKPPNAGVTTVVDGKTETAVVVLSEPKLEGTTISYSVRVIEGTLPRAGKTTSVFIDDVCLSCW
jgi:hypothetical protein